MTEVLAIAQDPRIPGLDDPVVRARTGRFDAFEDLYRSHVGRVFAICLRLSGDRSRAEELTQESFVRAWKGLKALRAESEFGAWVGRIAVNTALSERRSRRRRGAHEATVEDPDRVPAPSRRPRPGAAMDLEAAIAALPEGARTVFVLHDVEGYRHGEIGRLLGVHPGTSKAQLHRARTLLREALR